ncbi:hypothetical protein [Mycobacterium montefiorense]|uniref:hypothetical protein n=1 Tax=Mycobacterium montefiorense TaxID=154654 RepID=UPI001403610B|nr:hypothetical protein [Mycobacterium montefiorense]
MTRGLAGGAGTAGFVAGHLSGVVGCDFSTGRTGSGAIFTTGATGGGVGAVVLAEVAAGAGCWLVWQPHAATPSRMALVSLAVVVDIIDLKQSRSNAGCRPIGRSRRQS